MSAAVAAPASGFPQRRELCAPDGAFSGSPSGESVPGGHEVSGVDHRGAEAGDGVPGFLECRGRGAAALIEGQAVPVEGAACGAGAAATGVGGGDCLLEPAAAFGSGVEDVAGLCCGVGHWVRSARAVAGVIGVLNVSSNIVRSCSPGVVVRRVDLCDSAAASRPAAHASGWFVASGTQVAEGGAQFGTSCLDVPQGSGAGRGRVPVVAVEAGVFLCCPIVAGLSGRELLLRGGEVAGVVPGRDGLNGLLADWARLPGE